MKCKNCGADYPMKNLECPYCQTSNSLGKMWQKEAAKALSEVEIANAQYKEKVPYIVNSLLRRSVLVLLLGNAVLFVALFALLLFVFRNAYFYYPMHKNKVDTMLEEAYTVKDFERIYNIMNDYELFDPDDEKMYIYGQSALLYSDYRDFSDKLLTYLATDDDKKADPDMVCYELDMVIERAFDVIRLDDNGCYKELKGNNREQYEDYKKEAEAFLAAYAGATQEELNELEQMDRITFDAEKQLIDRVYEERAWER